MADPVPAVEVDEPVAAAAEESLLAPAPEKSEEKSDPAAAPADPESKPAEKAGDDGAKAEPSLLAKDDEGKTPKDGDGQTDPKADAAPEKYEAFKLPDGMALDEGTLAKATPLFQKFGLNQEKAQELVSLYADQVKAASESATAQTVAAHRTLVSEWTQATKAGEFGGDKLAASKATAMAAIEAFSASPKEAGELRNMLSEWGLANNPLLFGLLVRAGSKLLPDKLVHADPSAQSSEPKKPWEIIYGNSMDKPKE